MPPKKSKAPAEGAGAAAAAASRAEELFAKFLDADTKRWLELKAEYLVTAEEEAAFGRRQMDEYHAFRREAALAAGAAKGMSEEAVFALWDSDFAALVEEGREIMARAKAAGANVAPEAANVPAAAAPAAAVKKRRASAKAAAAPTAAAAASPEAIAKDLQAMVAAMSSAGPSAPVPVPDVVPDVAPPVPPVANVAPAAPAPPPPPPPVAAVVAWTTETPPRAITAEFVADLVFKVRTTRVKLTVEQLVTGVIAPLSEALAVANVATATKAAQLDVAMALDASARRLEAAKLEMQAVKLECTKAVAAARMEAMKATGGRR